MFPVDPGDIERALAEMFSGTLPPPLMAMITACVTIFESANEGECRNCQCDVCLTARGLTVGMKELVEGWF